jgi:hypothetical protein
MLIHIRVRFNNISAQFHSRSGFRKVCFPLFINCHYQVLLMALKMEMYSYWQKQTMCGRLNARSVIEVRLLLQSQTNELILGRHEQAALTLVVQWAFLKI